MAQLKQFFLVGLASALASSSARDSCDTFDLDQTALLQGQLNHKADLSLSQRSAQSVAFFPKLDSLNDPHTRKAALFEIEKTAIKLANMDKSEATPVVIEVCTDVAEMLNITVLNAIIDEDVADRAALQSAYDAFQTWEDQRAAAEAQILAAEAVVSERAMALSFCRTIEIEHCENETICTHDTEEHCRRVEILEHELREKDTEIHTSWCLEDGSVRTTTEFREGSVSTFLEYKEIWDELAIAMGLCHPEECETITTSYIEQAQECNTKQATMQQASCEYHHVVTGALTSYQQGFQQTLTLYNDLVAEIMIREADRKVEWTVITRVICLLLTLTNEEDGVVSSAETEARIQRCWDDFVDVSHLDIDYLDPPPMLSLPDLPPLPCTAEYDDMYNIGPPAQCSALVVIHNTQATSECTCLAEELANQGLMLGHYLLIDPDIEVNIFALNGVTVWAASVDGDSYSGSLSAISVQDFTALSSEMLSEDQLDETNSAYTGPIHSLVWAYPSETADWTGPLNLAQKFAMNGGLLFLGEAGQVIAARELASTSGPLGQPVSATLSFSSAEEITAAQQAAACPDMHPVSEASMEYHLGARNYCWVMGAGIPQCLNGCFIYETVSGPMVFPVIEGLRITQFQQVTSETD